jgi:PKD repeat protein
VAGGYRSSTSTYLDVLEIYDPYNKTWTHGIPMPVGLSGLGAVGLNGKLYVMGGNTTSGVSSALYKYDPSSGAWTQLASMNIPRSYFGAGVIDGKIYVFGGYGDDFLSSTEVYDPEANTWTSLASMEKPRYDLAGADYSGKLYAFGGNSQSVWDPPYIQDIEVYDPATDSWELDNHLLNKSRQGLRSIGFENNLFIAGGYTEGNSENINESVYIEFDPVVISSLSASPTSGVEPLEVSFGLEASGGSGSYTYSWSFGDGNTSTEQNPTHTYDTVDEFTVMVTVTDADDSSNSTTGELIVTTLEEPETISVGISTSPTTGEAPLTVTFTIDISGDSPPYTLELDFGDGTTETQSSSGNTAQVDHTYKTAGTYQMWVEVMSAYAGGSATQTIKASIGISVSEPSGGGDKGSGGRSGGCFIATAGNGS